MNTLEIWLSIALAVAVVTIACLIAWCSDLSHKWAGAESEVRHWRKSSDENAKLYRNLKKNYTANFGILSEVIADLQTVKPASHYGHAEEPSDDDLRGSTADAPVKPAG